MKTKLHGDMLNEQTQLSLDALEALAPNQIELWTRSDEAIPLHEAAKKYADYMRESGEQLLSLK